MSYLCTQLNFEIKIIRQDFLLYPINSNTFNSDTLDRN